MSETPTRVSPSPRSALSACAAVALLGAVAPPAHAQVCGEDRLEQSLQYLRRLSLDLRGRLPDMAELDSVVTNGGELDPSIIAGIVASEDLVEQIGAHHRELLWTNIGDLRLANQDWILTQPRQGGGIYYISSQSRARAYRGGNVPCLDEPARFGGAGEILTTPDANDATIAREGWVEVHPYWDPAATVRVCAFDAQANPTTTDARGRTVDCHAQNNARGCGCGPELAWCQSQPDGTQQRIRQGLADQLLRFVENIVRSGRPYHEILTAREVEVNGPVSHYLRFQASLVPQLVLALEDHGYTVPEVPFAETERWVSATRGAAHSGLLTLPGYLLKFQSDRGRANRFYNAFLCTSFVAPPGGLPPGDDPCNQEPNLTKRCGCLSCHLTVEPAAAYWGRWAEAGFAPLPSDRFPKINEACNTPQGARLPECRRLYFTDPQHPDEEPYKGYLRPYVFATPQMEQNIEQGPRAIAQAAIDNGRFARCAAQKLFERYLGRGVEETDAAALEALTDEFVAGGYDLRALVSAIVTRPEYAEAGRFDGGER